MQKNYKSLLGALLYIAVKSRFDIMFALYEASRICKNPTEIDFKNLMNIEHFTIFKRYKR